VRAALISIADNPEQTLAGKSLARRQLDFALAAGCERIIVLGNGSTAEAIALRHAAETRGAGFQAIGNSHGLLGMVRATDQLLLLAPGLLPEAHEALASLESSGIMVLPAGAGVAAGFERIDLERAWAGVALVPGSLVEKLADLPPDSEATSALMRAALQTRVPERRLSEEHVTDGSWSMIGENDEIVAIERDWLSRNMRATDATAPSKWIAQQALRGLAGHLLAAPHAFSALTAGALAVLAGAIAASWAGWAPVGFAGISLGALLAELATALLLLRKAPFGGRDSRWAIALAWMVDLALFACTVLAIEGSWPHKLFPPLVLMAALQLKAQGRPVAVFRDRAIMAVAFTIAAGFTFAEAAIMLAALTVVLLNVAPGSARRG